MKNGKGLIAFIVIIASLCAAAAVIVTNIDKIKEFIEAFKKCADKAFSECHCVCNCDEQIPEENDFEDVEL